MSVEVICIRVQFMDQIDLCEIICIQLEFLILYNCKLFVLRIVIWSYNCLLKIIISYLKPYNCVQTNYYYWITIINWNK